MILNNSFLKGRYPGCEVGFGTNDIIPNINYLPYLEKKFNTYHLGIGDNSNFGGDYQYGFHFDQVQNSVNWSLEILNG